MNPTALSICRKLLQTAQVQNVSKSSPLTPTAVAGDLSFQPVSGSSIAGVRRPFNPSTCFDSSMALTILVLLTALFFMGFFSVYIRCFTANEDSSPPSTTSASRRRQAPPNHKGGLDPSAVNSLPLVEYGKAAKHPMIDDCPICLGELQERETVKLIPYCGHVFHPRCIDSWLSSHVTCPLCRSAQLFKRIDDVGLDVKQEKNEFGTREIGERSTVQDRDTWKDESSAGVRRTCSYPNLADRAVLHRSTSF